MSDIIVRTNTTEWSGNTEEALTLSFECESYYRGLLVQVLTSTGSGTPSLTYNGVALTQIAPSITLGSIGRQMHLFYLQNPAQGTNDLVITPAASQAVDRVAVASYKHVSQSALINASVDGSAGTTGSWEITTTVADCWVVTAAAEGLFSDGDALTDGTNLVFFTEAGPIRMGDSNASVGAAGARTIGASYDNNDTWYYLSAAIAPQEPTPILDETTVSSIALRAAQSASEVLYDGDVTISERGFVIGLSTGPTIASGTKFIVTGTTGSFQAALTDLAVNTTYYVRSYATNAYGTSYGEEETFTTLNIDDDDLIKDIGAVAGENYAVSVNVGGTTGSITVKLGTTGTSHVMTAGGGVQTFEGTYNGADGLIITRSANFDGTIDDVMWVRVEGEGTVDWSLDTFTSVFPIESEVTFRRIEDQVFNSHRLYRYLDLMFKNRDGFVTVTITKERNNVATPVSKTFSVGNTTAPESPFTKRRISFLSKNQALLITLSNANVSETFSIARFLLHGTKESTRLYKAGDITSI